VLSRDSGSWPNVFFSAATILSFLVFSYFSKVFGDPPLVVDDAKPVDAGFWKFDWVMALSQPEKGARELDLPIVALTYGIIKGLDFGIGIQRIKSDASGEGVDSRLPGPAPREQIPISSKKRQFLR